ncbi:MAG: DUF2203 domain-containing protein [Elusimicrobia bacterium]|nr:DUF2203 domain-containing protein [Elusimicrobiota bacterium]
MNTARYFTPDEVNELIPQLEELVDRILMWKHRAEELAAKLGHSNGDPKRAPAATQLAEEGILDSQVKFLVDSINQGIGELLKVGGVMKDVDQGLVDFPASLAGREVWLCWRKGEKAVRYWHGLEEGVTGRKPLPRTWPKQTAH